MELTEAHFRYLLAIYELSRTMPEVGAACLARTLRVSKPSVTRMLNLLMERGLLVRERYGKVYLTDTGCLLARELSRKVELLKARVPGLGFALSEEETAEAACALALILPERCFRRDSAAPRPSEEAESL